jgi:hypothetical protein
VVASSGEAAEKVALGYLAWACGSSYWVSPTRAFRWSCPRCLRLGLHSRSIAVRGPWTERFTKTAFVDKNGVFHHHEPTRQLEKYSCSQGHCWEILRLPRPCGSAFCTWKLGER